MEDTKSTIPAERAILGGAILAPLSHFLRRSL